MRTNVSECELQIIAAA